MAVPKRRTSKAVTRSRKANWKVAAPGLGECPQCHELKKPHNICPKCGYYDGVQVVEQKEEKK